MYIVRERFTAKPGMASKLAALMKSVAPLEAPGYTIRVMTDYVAQFNTVVLETEVAELADFEKIMANYASNAELREKLKGYTDLYVEGRREVYKLV